MNSISKFKNKLKTAISERTEEFQCGELVLLKESTPVKDIGMLSLEYLHKGTDKFLEEGLWFEVREVLADRLIVFCGNKLLRILVETKYIAAHRVNLRITY